jgi:heme-degrading monooxygenase HmoA
MILIAHIKYSLSDHGMTEFANWFQKATSVLGKQPGFVSICYAKDPEDSHSMHIWIEFKERSNLNKWMESQAHEQLYQQLVSHCLKPFQATFYEVQAAASAESVGA